MAPPSQIRLCVIVPTYRRPADLRRCLDALQAQELPADEVVVAFRDADSQTAEMLASYDAGRMRLIPVTVRETSLVSSMNAALEKTTGDIVALTDDDSVPRPDWLRRIADCFLADPRLGGVGGRDWQPFERWDEPVVGKLQWFGRCIGNHHLGVGPPREVEILKGVNCAFRGELLRRTRFDTLLRGDGNVVHWELSLSFSVRRQGWKLVYDPAIAIEHNVAPRFDIDQRQLFVPRAHANSVHNETLALLQHLSPARRAAFLTWAVLLGTAEAPGLGQLPRLLWRRRSAAQVWKRFTATWAGRRAGLATFLRQRGRDAT